MKTITWILLCLLFVLMTLYPVGALIAASLGYTFELIKISAIALVIAVFSIAAFILERVNRNIPESMALRVLLSVLAPLSFINAALYIWACPQIWIIVSLFSSVACCIYLVVKYVKPRALKLSALILPGIMTLPLLYISFFGFFFGNIGKNTVVQTIYSPNEAYYAQLIDSDQGALGGATIVDVHEKGGINTFIFKTEKKSTQDLFRKMGRVRGHADILERRRVPGNQFCRVHAELVCYLKHCFTAPSPFSRARR